MTGDHTELVTELRALADTVLDQLDPILQKVAAGTGADTGDRSACSSCSWCPLCALAALIRGEQHDLVTLVAGQASTFLAALREALDAHERATTATSAGDAPPPAPPTAFVPIAVTIKD